MEKNTTKTNPLLVHFTDEERKMLSRMKEETTEAAGAYVSETKVSRELVNFVFSRPALRRQFVHNLKSAGVVSR